MTALAMDNPEAAIAASPTLNLLSGVIYATFAAIKAAKNFEQANGFRVTLWDLIQVYERTSQKCHPLSTELSGLDELIRAKRVLSDKRRQVSKRRARLDLCDEQLTPLGQCRVAETFEAGPAFE